MAARAWSSAIAPTRGGPRPRRGTPAACKERCRAPVSPGSTPLRPLRPPIDACRNPEAACRACPPALPSTAGRAAPRAACRVVPNGAVPAPGRAAPGRTCVPMVPNPGGVAWEVSCRACRRGRRLAIVPSRSSAPWLATRSGRAAEFAPAKPASARPRRSPPPLGPRGPRPHRRRPGPGRARPRGVHVPRRSGQLSRLPTSTRKGRPKAPFPRATWARISWGSRRRSPRRRSPSWRAARPWRPRPPPGTPCRRRG